MLTGESVPVSKNIKPVEAKSGLGKEDDDIAAAVGGSVPGNWLIALMLRLCWHQLLQSNRGCPAATEVLKPAYMAVKATGWCAALKLAMLLLLYCWCCCLTNCR
jgi:magnesium-transporting ATPase (P-type)